MRRISLLFAVLFLILGAFQSALAQDMTNDIESVTASSKWLVSDFQDGQRIPGFHSVPWVFEADGTVSAADLWSGNWAKESDDTIRVAIQDNAGNVTRFQVQFIRGLYFIAWQDGKTFRWGKRIVKVKLVP